MAVKGKAPKKGKKAAAAKRRSSPSQPSPAQLKVTLVRSVAGRPQKQREVIKGLGLRRMHSQVVRADSPEVRGMIRKISHLVHVEELEKK